MTSLETIGPKFHQIGAFSIPQTILDGLLAWRPYYWKTLSYDVREMIDANVLEFFKQEIKSYSIQDVEAFDPDYYQYVILMHVCRTLGYYRNKCFKEKRARERQISQKSRVQCGARKKTGQQCKAKAEKGRNRCRFHGGKSTGPKTIDGKIKSLSDLTQYKNNPDLLMKKRIELLIEMRIETGF